MKYLEAKIGNIKTVAEAALYYASLGFAVFPVHKKLAGGKCSCNNPDCRSPGKHPRTKNGLKEATTDPRIISFWWNNVFQGSGVGIATGRISGFFVIDVDVKHDGIRAWETFKGDHQLDDFETPVQITPSGGKHVFYKMPEEGRVKTCTDTLAKGIDTRGDGGYIVACPSPDYRYEIDQAVGEIELQEAPQAILDIVANNFVEDTTLTQQFTGARDLYRDEIIKINSALEIVDPDGYKMWWEIGAALHSTKGNQAFQIWCDWAKGSSKYDHNVQVAKWAEYEKREDEPRYSSLDIDYLYAQATKNDWVEVFDHSDVDFDSFNVTEEEFQAMKNKHAKESIQSNNELNSFKARTINGSFSPKAIPRREWLIHNTLMAGYINLLVSPGAVGKSMFTLIEAISIATGNDLLNLGQVTQGNVLIVNNEDDDNEIDRRISAICQYYRINVKSLENRLFIRSGYCNPVIIANEINRSASPSIEIENLVNFINKNNIVLLTIDPFVSTHRCNENDNSNIDTVVQYYKHIAGSTGAAIRLVHHTRKMGSEADNHAGDIESARGASSLKDAARSCHTLSRMGSSRAKDNGIDEATRLRLIRFDSAKNNFSLPDSDATWFHIESVKIPNGEVIGVLRPYAFEPAVKQELITPEKRKAKTLHSIGEATLIKLGTSGGKIKATEVKGEYMNLTGYKSSQTDNDFTLLPIGQSKSERILLNGNFYRIFQTKEDKRTAPRYIHLNTEK